MELLKGGQLFDYLLKQKNFSETQAHGFMVPVFDAIIYVHAQGVVHRDIKPENLLLSSENLEEAVIKVSDFDLARSVSE